MGFDSFCLLSLARVHAMVGDVDSARQMPPHGRDEKGRLMMPAYLLSAHKPS